MGVGAIELELPKDVGYNGKLYYEGGVEAKEPIDKSKKIFFKTWFSNSTYIIIKLLVYKHIFILTFY